MNKRRLIVISLLLVTGVILHLLLKTELYIQSDFSRAVYDNKGQLLRLTLSQDDKYRLKVPLKKISTELIRSTLLHEDQYHYYHPGVNPVALLKAVWQTYVQGGRRRGASTISMQYARMRFNINSRQISGKLQQILRALQLEWYYSKDEILEAYLNSVPYGGNIEGIAAASLIYFNKQPHALNMHEALTLTVIPQSPQKRLPFGGKSNMDNLLSARNRLLNHLLAEFPEYEKEKSLLALHPQLRSRGELPFLAPHFVNSLLARYAGHADKKSLNTTLELNLQQLLERTTRAYVESRRETGLYNTTAMLLDTRNMAVRAVVGSVDFNNPDIHGQVNGTYARRSPGSTLKPFIYALGIDQGLIHPYSLLKDSQTSFGTYNPENYDEEFSGPITVQDALVRSRNIPAVQVATKLNEPDLYGFLKNAGVKLPRSRKHYGLSLVLGGAELTMRELVMLYASLANKGMLRPLRELSGQIEEPGNKLLSEAASFMVLDMLQHNPRPDQAYRSNWLPSHRPVYWKTGTSYAFRDAWSIAVFDQYVLAVWVGNFDGQGNPVFIGRDAAAPLLFNIIDAIRAQATEQKTVQLIPANTVEAVALCAVSGSIPGKHCSHRISSWFIPGVSPIGTCDIHREVLVDKENGLRACSIDQQNNHSEVYEFWPSDLLKIFRKAGMPRRVPPPYHPDCKVKHYASAGKVPQIHSPRTQLSYQLRLGKTVEKIPFMAVTDTDARHVYWFVDDSFIGKAKQGEPLLWLPRAGEFIVRAIDDHGRGTSRELRVMTSQ